MNGFDFHIPTKILFGRGRVRDLGSHIPDEARRVSDRIQAIDRLFAPHGGIPAFLSGLDVPTRLLDYGVREDDVLSFAQKTIVKGDMRITPAEVTVEDLAGIYRSAL